MTFPRADALPDEGGTGGAAWRAAAIAAWLSGVAWQLRQPAVMPAARAGAWLAASVMAGALLLALARRSWRGGSWRGGSGRGRSWQGRSWQGRSWRAAARLGMLARVAACVLCGVAGFALASRLAAARLADRLDPALEGVALELTGRVVEMPIWREDGARLVFEVDAASVDGVDVRARVPSRLWLSWSRPQRDDRAVSGGPPALEPGQRWRLRAKLREPHGAVNPEGFDAELWLFEQGLRATGAVQGAGRLVAAARGAWVERLRQSVRDRLLLHGDDAAAAGVLAALAVGDQAAVDGSGWALFRDTGVAHLMSISGLHITMLAWLGGAAAAAAWRRSSRAAHLVPAPLAGRWAGVVVAGLYALVAGWGVPAQRTVVMLGATAGLRGVGRDWPAPLVTAAAAVPVTALDPWALLQPGFWLSFVAVGLLLVSDPARSTSEGAAATTTTTTSVEAVEAVEAVKAPVPAGRLPRARALALRLARWLRRVAAEGVRAQVLATLGLLPLTLAAFGQVPVVGFLANLVAVPWVTAVVTPLALLGVVVPPLWSLAALAVVPLMAALQALAALPFACVHVAAAPGWITVAALAGGFVAMLPLPPAWRVSGALLVLPLLAPPVVRPAPGRYELVAADVGQGSAVLVRTRGHLLLFDAGPRFTEDSDAGGRLLLPLLHARGERRIDLLVLSHRDMDHVGGARSILDGLPVAAMRSSLEPSNPLRREPPTPPHVRCEAGQRWSWDGVRFEMLHPFPEDYGVPDAKPNAVSCVLRVADAEGRSVLLTGDIEAPQEARLVARLGAAGLRSDVLVVPHHGSRTSSTDAFLDAVAPRLAVIQVGYRSRYGHPHPDVLSRYGAHGIPVVRTDTCGAWSSSVGVGRCTRVVRARYWAAVFVPDTGSGPGSDVANPRGETLSGARREPGRAPP